MGLGVFQTRWLAHAVLLWAAVAALHARAASAAGGGLSVQQDGAPPLQCSSSRAARFNFFPDSDVPNEPKGWTQAAQQHAGNMCRGQLLPVALYGLPKPLLHFQPQHDLLTPGAAVAAVQLHWESAAAELETAAPAAGQAVGVPGAAHGVAPGVADGQQQAASLAPGPPPPPPPPPPPQQQQQPRTRSWHSLFWQQQQASQDQQQQHQQQQQQQGRSFLPRFWWQQQARQQRSLLAADDSSASGNPGSSSDGSDGSGKRPWLVQQVGRLLTAPVRAANRVVVSAATAAAARQDVAAAAGMDLVQQQQQQLLLQSDGGQGAAAAAAAAATAANAGAPAASTGNSSSAASPVAAGAGGATQLAVSLPLASLSTAAAVKQTLGSSSATLAGSWAVVLPASFVYSVRVNGQHWFTSPVQPPGSGVPVLDFAGNATLGRRDLFDDTIFRDGINTLVIDVTLLARSALLGDASGGNATARAPAANETFSSPEVDFFFFMYGNATLDSRPSAHVSFESCRAEAAIRFRGASPTPVLIDGYRLTYTPVPARTTAFFLPVYYVYGTFTKGLDGSTDLHTDNTEGNVKSFGLYLTRLPGAPGDFSFTGPALDALKEGWWQFTVEGSLWVPLPHLASLLSLAGLDRYGNSDVLYRQVQPHGAVTEGLSLLNSVKGAGWVLPGYDKLQVGLQKAVTVLEFFEGPSTPLVLGDKATFAWQYTGLDTGRYSCTIEGSSTVSLAGPCSSPLTYTVRTTLNQTLAVSYEDVCHAQHNASLTFGPGFGWEVEAKELGESPPLHTLSSSGSGGGGGPATLLRTNGGGATRPPTARKLLAALAGALLVGALLL